MKQIPVVPRDWRKPTLYALVDDKNFDFLNKFTWYPRIAGKTIYANTNINNRSTGMHTLVLPNSLPGVEIDHKNGNGLDNQEENLRLATKSQQRANQSLQNNSTSGFKGVAWFKRDKCWRAYISCKGIQVHLGYFKSKELAAEAYNKAAMEAFGEFAKLNEVSK